MNYNDIYKLSFRSYNPIITVSWAITVWLHPPIFTSYILSKFQCPRHRTCHPPHRPPPGFLRADGRITADVINGNGHQIGNIRYPYANHGAGI